MDGRAFRVLTVVDQWSRWSPILEVAQSMTGAAVAAALERAIVRHGQPRSITVDHGTEFTSRALDEWAYRRGVALDFIRPGKPTENGYIELTYTPFSNVPCDVASDRDQRSELL